MTRKFDVIVVGAGMTGVTIACLLAKQGLKLALVDNTRLAKWSAETDHPRVSAINPATINIFKHIDLWEAIQNKRVSPYTRMRVWDEQTHASIAFDAIEIGQPFLGAIVENNAIVDSALERLRQNYLVSIFENTTIKHLEGGSVHASLFIEGSDHCLEADLIIDADGAHSLIRELSNIDTHFEDYAQQAIVTTLSTEKEHQLTAWQCFTQTGPAALLPLEDGQCSLVWSCDNRRSDHLMSLRNTEFCNELTSIFGDKLGAVSGCTERFCFPLRQHHAENYFEGKSVLIGDAAHTTHPLTGQGANIGFMDAAALSQVVAEALSRRQAFNGHTVLRRYERWRYGENQLVLSLMKNFESFFSATSENTKKVREIGINLTDRLPPVKYRLAQYAMGLMGDLPAICKDPDIE